MNEYLKLFEKIIMNSNIALHKLQFPFENPEQFHLGFGKESIKENVIFHHLRPLLLSFEKEKIYFFQDFFQCSYAAFYASDTLLLVGPILTEEISELYFEKLFSKYPLLKHYGTSLFQYYNHLMVIPAEHFFKNICISFGNVLCGTECSIIYTDFYQTTKETIPFDTFFKDKDPVYTYVQIMEEYIKLEDDFLLTVSTGNEIKSLEKLESLLKVLSFSATSNLNRINDIKNYIWVLHTCLRKIFEKNTIHPAHIGKLTTQILLEAKQCTNTEQLHTVFRDMVKIYCYMAQENSNKSVSPLIHRILAYTQIELTGDLSLKAFAKRLNVNTSYLSTLFSKEMGMTLTEYVNQCRVAYAKNLLINTQYSINKIALQCGFSDAKYFSRVFKKLEEISPTEYRNTKNK